MGEWTLEHRPAMLEARKTFADFPYLEQSAVARMNELVWWATTLRNGRRESS